MVREGKKLEFISLHGNTLRHDDDCGCRMLARLLPAAHGGRVELAFDRLETYSNRQESTSRDLFQILTKPIPGSDELRLH